MSKAFVYMAAAPVLVAERLFRMSYFVLTVTSAQRICSYSWRETFSRPLTTSASTLAAMHKHPGKLASAAAFD